MPFITNINLEIVQGRGGDVRQLNVDCQFKFVGLEVQTRSWFVVRYYLCGWDSLFEDPGIYIRADSVQATEEFVSHKFSQNVLRSQLDEDPDWNFAMRDEVYLRVTLEPWVPRSASANSNIVTGQWGARGSD